MIPPPFLKCCGRESNICINFFIISSYSGLVNHPFLQTFVLDWAISFGSAVTFSYDLFWFWLKDFRIVGTDFSSQIWRTPIGHLHFTSVENCVEGVARGEMLIHYLQELSPYIRFHSLGIWGVKPNYRSFSCL